MSVKGVAVGYSYTGTYLEESFRLPAAVENEQTATFSLFFFLSEISLSYFLVGLATSGILSYLNLDLPAFYTLILLFASDEVYIQPAGRGADLIKTYSWAAVVSTKVKVRVGEG